MFPIVLSTDLAVSRAFYHDTLGLDVLREDDERIAPDPKTEDRIADTGFAWAAWIVDPHRNVLGIIQLKTAPGP